MGRTHRVRSRIRKCRAENGADSDSDIFNELHRYLSRAGWRNESRLSVRAFQSTGRGLCSKRTLHPNDLLIRVPFDCLISLKTLEHDLDFKAVFNSVENFPHKELSFQGLLAFYVIFHQHRAQSQHQTYIATIPEFFTNPFFCAKQELHFLPDAILEKIVAQNHEIKAFYELLSKEFTSAVCECCNSSLFPNIFGLDQFKWAYFAVNSRCVYVDPIVGWVPNSYFLRLIKDEPKLALAPFLDLLNHSDSANTISQITSNEPFQYELYTQRGYSRYEQVFISYGELPNSKLLVEYGFYIPGNKHDFFEIALTDIELLMKSRNVVGHRNKFKFIRDHNLDQQMFIHRDEGPSHNLVVALYLLLVEESVFPNVLSQVAFGSSEHFESLIHDEIRTLVQLKLEEYERFVKGLEGFTSRTESGEVVLGYLKECISYLSKFLCNY